MRPRAVPFALAVLLLATSAHSATVTQWAVGTVTTNDSFVHAPSSAPIYQFAINEGIEVEFTYDPAGTPAGAAPTVVLRTSGGFAATFGPAAAWSVSSSGDRLRILVNPPGRFVDLRFDGPSGTIWYDRPDPVGGELSREGFRGTLTRQDAAPLPEPGGLGLGIMGVVLAGLGWTRRRKRAA